MSGTIRYSARMDLIPLRRLLTPSPSRKENIRCKVKSFLVVQSGADFRTFNFFERFSYFQEYLLINRIEGKIIQALKSVLKDEAKSICLILSAVCGSSNEKKRATMLLSCGGEVKSSRRLLMQKIANIKSLTNGLCENRSF